MDRSHQLRQYSSAYRYVEHDERDWRRTYDSQPQRKKDVKMSSKCVALRRLIIAIFVILAVIIAVVALILYFYKNEPTVTRVCPPGFTGEQCERSDFLGSLTWYADDFYTLDDGFQYRNGLAFRIYAPSAKSVTIHCVSFSGARSEYKMMFHFLCELNCRKQDSGHWFYDVGGIGVGSEYYVTLTNSNEKQYQHLIQNGKEVYVFCE